MMPIKAAPAPILSTDFAIPGAPDAKGDGADFTVLLATLAGTTAQADDAVEDGEAPAAVADTPELAALVAAAASKTLSAPKGEVRNKGDKEASEDNAGDGDDRDTPEPADPSLTATVIAAPVIVPTTAQVTAIETPAVKPIRDEASAPQVSVAAQIAMPVVTPALASTTPAASATGSVVDDTHAAPTASPEAEQPTAAHDTTATPAQPIDAKVAERIAKLIGKLETQPDAAPAKAQGADHAASIMPTIAQLGLPGLARALTGFAKGDARGRAAEIAPPASKETAPASTPNFIVSSILPLLPQSLHALVLGQSDAPAAIGDTAPTLDGAQVMIEKHLDLAHEGAWLDQLAKDIARTGASEGSLRFKLNPETLGSLHVEVSHGAHGAAVRMTADTETARAIIADAQPRLVAEARAQGLKISESHVDLSSNGQQGDPRRHAEQAQAPLLRTAAAPAPAETQTEIKRTRSAAERYA